jgi:molybdenum cofactor biosynthesis protein B
MIQPSHLELASALSVRCAVNTASDTRTEATDTSGKLMVELLRAAGHEITRYAIVSDEPSELLDALRLSAEVADVVLFNGGTGISRRDSTVEVVSRELDKAMPGFGELFRMLSFEEVGAAAMLSRAAAGVYRDRLVFCTPGSTAAVRLAMERLIVPQLKHLLWEVVRQKE